MNARTVAGLASLAIFLAGTTAPTAMFVVYRSVWGLTTGDLGLIFAAYVGTLLPVLLLFGGIADRIGRRAAVAIGVALALGGVIVLVFANGFAGLLLARLLQGAGVGIASGALTASVTETHRGPIAAGALSTMASSVGIFFGPLSVAIAYDLGAGLHAAYVPILVLTIACGLALRLLAPRVVPGETGPIDAPLPREMVARALWFALPVTFVSWTGMALFLSMVPAYLAATLHAHDPLVGAGVIAAAQVAGIATTLRLRATSPERAGIVAPLVVVIGLIALVSGTALHGIAAWALVIAATVLVGGGGGLAFASAVVVATRVARGQRARVFARLFVAAYLGFALPSFAVGTIAAHSSLAAGFIVAIVVLGAVVAALPALCVRAALNSVPG
ncbi:MAG: MFS transporter [Candidatus Elarobacter sp.]